MKQSKIYEKMDDRERADKEREYKDLIENAQKLQQKNHKLSVGDELKSAIDIKRQMQM